jgi:hypothetical protein
VVKPANSATAADGETRAMATKVPATIANASTAARTTQRASLTTFVVRSWSATT